MAIVQTVNFSMFRRAFDLSGRSNQFSDLAFEALFNHLESISEDTGEPVELDVIALCGEYCEATADEVNLDYLLGYEKQEDEEEEHYIERLNEDVKEWLENKTIVIMAENGNFVYQQF